MSCLLTDKRAIFIQIKEVIEDQIIKGQLREHDQIPSTTQMVDFYKVNHITISKGVALLGDDGIVYKKRGVGMFVSEGAREKLIQNRKKSFANKYVLPMILEAKKLKLTDKDLLDIISKTKECEDIEY